MRRELTLAVALSLSVISAADAQGILVVSQNKCSFAAQERLQRMTDSLWVPIAQELVNEGKLTSMGSAYHAWGDEWNVVLWYTAPSISAFIPAFNELARRFIQRHPGQMELMQSSCTEHKDSMYSMGKTTGPPASNRP